MSFESPVAELSFETDGVSTAFPLSSDGGALFFMAAGDIRAVYAPTVGSAVTLVNGVDFTVSGDGRTGSGTLTTNAARSAGILRVWCETPAVQPEQYEEGDGFPALTHERAQDRHAMQGRDTARRLSRALMAPAGDAPGGMTLPALADRKGKLLGFDSTTGLPTVSLPDAAAIQASVAAVTTAIANFNILIGTYGTPFRTGPNIFDLLTPTEIATVLGGDNSLNLMTKVQTAMTANPNTEWEWPGGHYFLDGVAALSLPEGISWKGRGIGKTILKVGATPWGIEQLNPNGIAQKAAFQVRGIEFLFSNNGIRIGSAAGGYDDTVATQDYNMRSVIEGCKFKQNSVTAGLIGLQVNKLFNSTLRDNLFDGFAVQFDAEGSDMIVLEGANRFDNATDGAILAQSHGTFGTNLIVGDGTDINNPKNYGIRSNYRKIEIAAIHGEMDFSPGSTGTDGNMEAFIDIITGGGSAFHTTIQNNLLPVGTFADKWLRYRSDNPYSLCVVDNSAPGLMGAVDIGVMRYFTNSGQRTICIHHGNLEGESSFPMNTTPADVYPGGGLAALLTASRPGVYNATGLGAIVGGVKCLGGDFFLPADANTGHFIEFADWNGWPANELYGTFDITVESYGSVAGQVLSWELRDGGSVISSGTITNTTINKRYRTAICSAQAFTSSLRLRVWNADIGHGGNCYVRKIEVEDI